MTCRDRTSEFSATIKTLQSKQVSIKLNAAYLAYGAKNANGAAKTAVRATANGQHSEFMAIARKIGHDLANTFAKLDKLTILARKKSLFDDRPDEIQQLTFAIKQDINVLNKQIGQLQQLSRAQQMYKSHHLQTHSNSVVVSLQSHLASMSNKFKSVLEVRTENIKQQKSRREQFSQPVSVTSSLPPSVVAGNLGSVLLMDDAKGTESTHLLANGGSEIAINMDSVDKQRYQQQLQLIDQQDAYIQSRADAMVNIEQTIVELGTIFQQLAHMVKEQDEMVQRIDANVEDAQLNIEAAHTELVKYFQSVTSNRWLMVKIFGILIFFFIIFVVLLV